MEFKFKLDDRVRLTQPAITFYGGVWPHFIPHGQGGGTAGTIIETSQRPFKAGTAPRPYMVRWDNGVVNSYREDDLTLDDSTIAVAQNIDDESPLNRNIIDFQR